MPILSDEVKAMIEEAFIAADIDGSGYLDAGEIKAMLDKVAETEGFEAPSAEAIQARVDQIPTDEPGKIKLEGVIFMIAMMKVLAITVTFFSAADSDSSGVLEADELKAVAKKVHLQVGAETPSDEDLDNMVGQLGGSVDFDTFAAFFIPVVLEAYGVTVE